MSYHIREPTRELATKFEALSTKEAPRVTTAGGVDNWTHAEFMEHMRRLGGNEPTQPLIARSHLAGVQSNPADNDYQRKLTSLTPSGVREVPRATTAGIVPKRSSPSGIVSLNVPRQAVAGVETPLLPVRHSSTAGAVSSRTTSAGADNVPRQDSLDRISTAGPEQSECEAKVLATRELKFGAYQDAASGDYILPHSGLRLLSGQEGQELFKRHLTSGCGSCSVCLNRFA